MFVGAAVLIIGMGAVGTDHVDIPWNDHTEDLFACPKRFGLQNGWLWKLAIPVWNPHH